MNPTELVPFAERLTDGGLPSALIALVIVLLGAVGWLARAYSKSQALAIKGWQIEGQRLHAEARMELQGLQRSYQDVAIAMSRLSQALDHQTDVLRQQSILLHQLIVGQGGRASPSA